MKYLSDLLYVDIRTSSFAGQYKNYNVRLICPTLEGSEENENLVYVESFETIYTGTIYGTGNIERIYLNDIIASHVYDNSYAIGAREGDYWGDMYNENPLNVIFQCDVYIEGMFATLVADGEYILNMYKDPKIPRYDIQKLNEGTYADITNTLTLRTNVYPRVPKLPYSTKNFWLAGLFIARQAWLAKSRNSSGEEVWFYGKKVPATFWDPAHIEKSPAHCRTYGQIIAASMTGDIYEAATSRSEEIYIMPYEDMFAESAKWAEVDTCPAPYYLIWIDRSGAYQCQPLEGKCTLSESIETSYRVNAIDESIPYNKNVTNRWKLNSGWLNYDQYKAYESIITSKYLYLFDTENDEGYEVVIDTNEWTEKTQQNKDKAFNLQIDVHAARPQNILY